MRPFRRSPRLAGLCAAALALAAATAALAAPRVVAIGDVHGDLPALRTVLRAANVLDPNDAWVGGDTIVVQLGDLIDRGPAMFSALDFAMELEQKAAASGGRFVSLLGNHEVMNLVGDLRYVVPENYAELVDSGSEKRQAKAWREFEKWQKRRATARGEVPPPSGEEDEKAWLAAHPPGLVEQREAFGPAGKYGRWLRSRRALLVEQATLFVHGGVAPTRIGKSLDEIDRQVHVEIALFDELRGRFVADGLVLPFFDLPEMTFALRAELAGIDRAEAAAKTAAEQAGKSYTTPVEVAARRAQIERFLAWGSWSIFASDGPTWFRGYGHWTDEEGAVELPKLIGAYGVERFVVGHTPQPKGSIESRFDGAVYLVDTGMLSSYFQGGRGSALELDGGTVSAIYQDGARELLRQAAAGAAPASSAQVAPPASTAPSAPSAPKTAPAAPSSAPSSAPSAASSTALSTGSSTASAAAASASSGTNGADSTTPPAADTAPAAAPPPAPEKSSAGAARGPSGRPFLGPDGQPLPFATDEELLDFLREAKVVEVKDIGQGITHPRRFTLERDGVRARAIFRDVLEEKRVANVGGGRRELNFRDYYGFEPAAYRISLLLGLDRVPPADLRRHEGANGSIQIWIEKGMPEDKRRETGVTPPETLRWKRQLQVMSVWDALVGNTDRNQGNILFGPDWSIWFIDHTRTFRQSTDLPNADKIIWCERGLFEKLRSVPDDEIRAAGKGLLTSGEIKAVLARRKKLVEHLEGLIRAKGESAVLFDGLP